MVVVVVVGEPLFVAALAAVCGSSLVEKTCKSFGATPGLYHARDMMMMMSEESADTNDSYSVRNVALMADSIAKKRRPTTNSRNRVPVVLLLACSTIANNHRQPKTHQTTQHTGC
jgi:hypothetical protein